MTIDDNIPETQPQTREWDSILLENTECHCIGTYQHRNTNEEVCLTQKFDVCESVLDGFTRFSKEKIGFWFLFDEGHTRDAIRQHGDDDHLNGRQRLWETEENSKQNWPEFAKGSGGKEVEDDFFEIVKDETTVFDTDDDTGERFQEDLF